MIQSKLSTGRAGSMQIWSKLPLIEDVTSVYFNHEIWKRGPKDPVPDAPLDVQLELINRCNLGCQSCPINKHTRPKSMLSWDILKDIVDQAAEDGVCYFTICGIGEASLHPNLFDLLKYIREKKVEIKGLREMSVMPSVLITNAVWSDTQIERCLEDPPDLLSASLAGLGEEITERRGGLNVDRFYNVLNCLYTRRKKLPVIHVSTHIYPIEMENREKIEQFKEKWWAVSDAVIVKPTMLNKHHKEYQRFLMGGPLVYDNISEVGFSRTAPCMETSRRLSIDSDGNVWCGHYNSEDFGEPLGNVYQQRLKEIWHGEAMNEFRRQARAALFDRDACKLCGGEIRDNHRKI